MARPTNETGRILRESNSEEVQLDRGAHVFRFFLMQNSVSSADTSLVGESESG